MKSRVVDAVKGWTVGIKWACVRKYAAYFIFE